MIYYAKQAVGEGKSGPVETRLTGPAATALLTCKRKVKKINSHWELDPGHLIVQPVLRHSATCAVYIEDCEGWLLSSWKRRATDYNMY